MCVRITKRPLESAHIWEINMQSAIQKTIHDCVVEYVKWLISTGRVR